jgi:NAD(P)-dependent dehydrogenase (short-subunit alcohol dehydrogenase family)
VPDQLNGQVAVITGGASGMGRATALLFASEGAKIVVADLDVTRGEETKSLVEAAGGSAVFQRTDTSREADTEALADAAIDAFGRIDALVVGAGISHAGYVSGEMDDVDPLAVRDSGFIINKPTEHWEKVLNVNLTGVMLTDRAIALRMIAAGNGGAIVNIASGAAKVPIRGLGDYCVSKAGVLMLTKVLALELAPHAIRVNAIGPGVIDTPMTATITADEERKQQTVSRIPLGRLGEADDIAQAALFLVGSGSSYVTGQILHPDGGTFTG